MAGALLRGLQALEMANQPTARWNVPLTDGNHVVEFEHGTATGRRVVRVDGNTLVHREWMFRLVGDEVFVHADTRFVIRVDPIPGLRYCYSLWVNGKSYKNFIQSQSKILESWLAKIGNDQYRIILDKDSRNVWVNGELVETENEFVDGGAEISLTVGELPAIIRCSSSGQKDVGIKYELYLDGMEISGQGLLSELK